MTNGMRVRDVRKDGMVVIEVPGKVQRTYLSLAELRSRAADPFASNGPFRELLAQAEQIIAARPG